MSLVDPVGEQAQKEDADKSACARCYHPKGEHRFESSALANFCEHAVCGCPKYLSASAFEYEAMTPDSSGEPS